MTGLLPAPRALRRARGHERVDEMVVSFWNSHITHVPISLAVSQRKRIDPEGSLWSVVLASTGRPREMHRPVRAAGAPSAVQPITA
jgi:6-phosphofructokinase 1